MRFKLHYYMLPPSWNHLLYYVHLDDRAKDLRTTTSPTQALSDEYDNNSVFISAVKITAWFRPGLNLSPRWTHRGPSRSSKPPARLVKARINDLPQKTQTLQKHSNYTTNWNNWYLLNYLTLLRLFPSNVKEKDEPRNRQRTVYKINCSNCHASYNLTTRLTDDLPWKAGLPTWNRLPSTSVNQYWHHTNDSFTTLTLQTNRTERPNFTNGSRPTNHDWPTPLESYSP